MQTFTNSLHLQAHRLGRLIVEMCLLVGISTLQAQNDKKADDAYLGANGLFNLGLYEQAARWQRPGCAYFSAPKYYPDLMLNRSKSLATRAMFGHHTTSHAVVH